MNSEDKLIESLEGRLRSEAADFRACSVKVLGDSRAANLFDEAASELSRRSIRIEELEKVGREVLSVMAEAEKVDSRKADPTEEWVARYWKAMMDLRQALSDHPDKEGGE
jgi:hypothetical protein